MSDPDKHVIKTMRRKKCDDLDLVIRFWRYASGLGKKLLTVNFDIYEVVDEYANKTEMFENKIYDARGSEQFVTDIEQARAVVRGFTKWDGCTQMWFADCLHYDDGLGFEELFDTVIRVRKECRRLIGENVLDGLDDEDLVPDDVLVDA